MQNSSPLSRARQKPAYREYLLIAYKGNKPRVLGQIDKRPDFLPGLFGTQICG
jgi:hypothetical protein